MIPMLILYISEDLFFWLLCSSVKKLELNMPQLKQFAKTDAIVRGPALLDLLKKLKKAKHPKNRHANTLQTRVGPNNTTKAFLSIPTFILFPQIKSLLNFIPTLCSALLLRLLLEACRMPRISRTSPRSSRKRVYIFTLSKRPLRWEKGTIVQIVHYSAFTVRKS